MAPADVDGDGDLDLFVGGRQTPGKYPYPASSLLLLNTGSTTQPQYTDATATLAPALANYGMVTDAVWADVNNDSFPELVTVGEWMAPTVLLNQAGKSLAPQQPPATADTGWWFALAAADINADGTTDLIGGNLGLNYKYKATAEAPFEVYAHDFDGNGTEDIVLSYHEAAVGLVPLRGRECSSQQMPFIKSKFASYDAFARAQLPDVFGQAQLQQALHYTATTFASTCYLGNGQGGFTAQALPNMAQLTSINAIVVHDFTGNGHPDLLVAGNLYGAEVETPRNDAGIGLLLQGNGQGQFSPVPNRSSGLHITGEVRAMAPIVLGPNQQPAVVIAKNNDGVQLLMMNYE